MECGTIGTMKLINLNPAKLNLQGEVSSHEVLLGDLTIMGVSFHVMFIPVTEPNGTETDSDSQDMIDAITDSDGGDSYRSVTYRGQPYFVVIHPFQY